MISLSCSKHQSKKLSLRRTRDFVDQLVLEGRHTHFGWIKLVWTLSLFRNHPLCLKRWSRITLQNGKPPRTANMTLWCEITLGSFANCQVGEKRFILVGYSRSSLTLMALLQSTRLDSLPRGTNKSMESTTLRLLRRWFLTLLFDSYLRSPPNTTFVWTKWMPLLRFSTVNSTKRSTSTNPKATKSMDRRI